jgi:F1F0 ATPase subunit 2
MSEFLMLALALAEGLSIGAIFFGGLWWTVHKAVSSKHPALWFLASLLLRMTIALTGFYFGSAGHWDRLLLCLLGFFLARLSITWLMRPLGVSRTRDTPEVTNAP